MRTNFDGFWNVKTVDLTSSEKGNMSESKWAICLSFYALCSVAEDSIENLNQPHHLPWQESDLLG